MGFPTSLHFNNNKGFIYQLHGTNLFQLRFPVIKNSDNSNQSLVMFTQVSVMTNFDFNNVKCFTIVFPFL